MFHFLGNVVRRGWAFLLAAWILLVVSTQYAAPPWDEVAQDREFAFLPEDSPSRRAEEVYAKAFPTDRLASNVVLVVRRAGEKKALAPDLKFVEDVLEPALRKIADDDGGLADQPAGDEPLFADDSEPSKPARARSLIARIRTPNALGVGPLLMSADGKALLVLVELTTEFLSHDNWPIIAKIENLVGDLRQQGKLPAGVDIALTGSAVIGRDHTRAELQSAHATETLTVVLVIGLLLLIYRAPLLALIPLATVFISVRIAINVLAILAGAGVITLFQGVQIYITILAYGAGVDYCLFLMARYKEELDRGGDPHDAVARAVGGVGGALVASAATVMCGIGMMIFAEFGKFREAGFAIPFALLLVLCATLTFSPSLLRLAGRWAFWPQRQQPSASSASAPSAEPKHLSGFFQAGGLQRIWERVGEILLRHPGRVWLATVAIMAPFVLVAGLQYNRLSYDLIGELPASAPSVAGTKVLEEHFPAGIMGPVTVLVVNPRIDFSRPQGHDVVKHLTGRLAEERRELGLTDIRSLTSPLGLSPREQPADDLKVSAETRREATERASLEHYVTDLGERAKVGTRLELVLEQSPFSHRSVEELNRLEQAVREALPPEFRDDSQVSFVGPTASVRDLANVIQRDRGRIEVLVLASVFLILVVLLRRLLVPLYLLLSVLFSYYATLGAAFAFFWMLDPQGFTGIDWKVAIFLFTILIAVGEDYNIFLITRIDEEERQHEGPRGITEALAKTGPIISSCGIIMAGTFASLLAGSLTEMKQLGFALAFGVLLDTFVVRPILVPAFLILLRSGRLPLTNRLRKSPPIQAETPQAPRPLPAP